MALNNFDLWRCERLCAPLNKANISKKSCLCFLSCLCDRIFLRKNGFYIKFSCCRFLCPTYPSLSRCVSATLFLLIIGFYVAVAMILFSLLVLVWQQQDFFPYCWFLCGSSKTSYCWFCDNNKVSLFLYAWSVGLVRCWVGIWSGCAWMMKC